MKSSVLEIIGFSRENPELKKLSEYFFKPFYLYDNLPYICTHGI